MLRYRVNVFQFKLRNTIQQHFMAAVCNFTQTYFRHNVNLLFTLKNTFENIQAILIQG